MLFDAILTDDLIDETHTAAKKQNNADGYKYPDWIEQQGQSNDDGEEFKPVSKRANLADPRAPAFHSFDRQKCDPIPSFQKGYRGSGGVRKFVGE